MKPAEVQRRIAEIEECLDDNKCPTNTPRILERALEALKALAPPADLVAENERLRRAVIKAEAEMIASKMRPLRYASDAFDYNAVDPRVDIVTIGAALRSRATQPAAVVDDAMVERACNAMGPPCALPPSWVQPSEQAMSAMRAALTAALGPDPLAAPTPATKPAKQNA